MLKGKKIVLGVCGSVAAIESPRLARELRRRGATVYCVMSSQNIITADVMEWATDNPVITRITGKTEHVQLMGLKPTKADLLLIAPSTANTISKIAHAVDDTPITTFATTAFGSKTPIMIVPAMHLAMYQHPILKENIKKLKKHGVEFIEPRISENKAKIADIYDIADRVEMKFVKKDLKNKRILVTAGATTEDIDNVRYISNKSSGKMGVALANEAYARGAKVTLISANARVSPKYSINEIKVNSVKEMFDAIKQNIKQDIIIHAAAVSDFSVEKKDIKIKSDKKIKLELTPTTKIINQIKKLNKKVKLVGFKADSNMDGVYEKLRRSKADFIVYNDITKEGIGFNSDYNEVRVIGKNRKVTYIPKAHKKIIANKILDVVK